MLFSKCRINRFLIAGDAWFLGLFVATDTLYYRWNGIKRYTYLRAIYYMLSKQKICWHTHTCTIRSIWHRDIWHSSIAILWYNMHKYAIIHIVRPKGPLWNSKYSNKVAELYLFGDVFILGANKCVSIHGFVCIPIVCSFHSIMQYIELSVRASLTMSCAHSTHWCSVRIKMIGIAEKQTW